MQSWPKQKKKRERQQMSASNATASSEENLQSLWSSGARAYIKRWAITAKDAMAEMQQIWEGQ